MLSGNMASIGYVRKIDASYRPFLRSSVFFQKSLHVYLMAGELLLQTPRYVLISNKKQIVDFALVRRLSVLNFNLPGFLFQKHFICGLC